MELSINNIKSEHNLKLSHEECKGCNGAILSDCCTAPIIHNNICTKCRERCRVVCTDCEFRTIKKEK